MRRDRQPDRYHALMNVVSAIERCPPLAELTSASREEIVRGGSIRTWEAGEALWEETEAAAGLHFLLDGSVRIVRQERGREWLVHEVDRPGEPFGDVPLFTGDGYPARAVAAEATRCLFVPERALQAALAADPKLARELLAGLARRLGRLVGRLGRLATASVGERLRAWLAGSIEVHEGELEVRYGSHAALATEIGTAREVVSREIGRLREAGIVASAGRGRLRVLDAARLGQGADP